MYCQNNVLTYHLLRGPQASPHVESLVVYTSGSSSVTYEGWDALSAILADNKTVVELVSRGGGGGGDEEGWDALSLAIWLWITYYPKP